MKHHHMRLSRIMSIAAGSFLFVGAQAAMAYYQPGPTDPNFELDANIMDDGTVTGDDWSNIANAFTTTGIMHDPASTSIFTTGGSKDIRDISSWKWKDGSVPDKDEILHAYAAAYGEGTELILYLGADRYSNDGDAMMGAWFFQDVVEAESDGTFSGVHKNGDILWLGHFTGGGVIATMHILVWNDPGLDGYDSSLEQVKNSNLAYLVKDSQGAGAGFFATVNQSDVEAPASWNYVPKQGMPNYIPYNSFMEGGINITYLLGGQTPCFSSFLIESRSSAEVNAQLKDFVLGNLNTCKIDVVKSCNGGAVAADMESIDWSYSTVVTNSGYGQISQLDLRDDAGTATNGADDYYDSATVAMGPGDTYTFNYTINSKINGPSNWVYVDGKVGDYALSTVANWAECGPVTLSPVIDVTKNCDKVILEEKDGKLVVRVDISGTIENTGTNTKLKDISVTDDVMGTLTPSKNSLLPGETATFSGSYYPDKMVGSGNPHTDVQQWTDIVTATGNEPITGDTVQDTDSATCRLCPTCPPCP